jgi:Flp pilus assembly protein TadG
MFRRLARHTAASTTVEFGLTASILTLTLLGIIQGGIIIWTWQAMESAAIDAARCFAIGAPSCGSTTDTQTYAVSTAQGRGINGVTAVASSGATAKALCGQTASVVAVAVSCPFGWVPYTLAPTLKATACFPLAG